MKSLRYLLLISILGLILPQKVHACWADWDYANEYYMFRVYDPNPSMMFGRDEVYEASRRNCEAWQRLTSMQIPIEDIYEVVYKMTLEEVEQLYDAEKYTGKNSFARWLKENDRESLDFMLLAKTNEYIRLKRNSRWYYPSMRIGARMSIEEVAETALSHPSKRLRDRYLLQGVRALFTLGRYAECVEIWEKEAKQFNAANPMRELIQSYVAGAEARLGHKEKALQYFAEVGDVYSMSQCMGKDWFKMPAVEQLEMAYNNCPNSKYLPKALQESIRRIERDVDNGYEEIVRKESTDSLYKLTLRIAKDRRNSNPAMWYYAASFIADMKGCEKDASYLLSLAERAKGTPYVKESIRLFRFYLDAKLRPCDATYDSWVLGQLRWLDAKIVDNLTDEVRETTRTSENKLTTCVSYYYWNDMMRRIVLSEVCPRLLANGRSVKALQLANMADNRLLQLVDEICPDPYSSEKTVSMAEYRYDADLYNPLDYRNYFFEMIDSLGASTAMAYQQRIISPKSQFDRFVNERSYTDPNYINDIVGTQCLREMRYKDAVKYLGEVDAKYAGHLNVRMNRDPFGYEPTAMKNAEFRYSFAHEMYALEQEMKIVTNPTRKAKLMVRYAIGLRNSFGQCWPLTQYYRGTSFWGAVCDKRDWEQEQLTLRARSRSSQMINQAIALTNDQEYIAELLYQFGNFKTIATKYPNTQIGKKVRGKCDKLIDYHAEKSF